MSPWELPRVQNFLEFIGLVVGALLKTTSSASSGPKSIRLKRFASC